MIDATTMVWEFFWDNVVEGSPNLLVLVGFVGLLCWLGGQKPSRYALLPLGMFVVLLGLNLLWSWVVDIPPAVGHMAASGFVDFDETMDPALMAALAEAQRLVAPAADRQLAENADRLVVAITYPALVDAVDWAKKIFLACIYGTASIYAVVWVVIWCQSEKIDLLAKLTAVGLVFADLWTLFVHVIGCDLVLAGADRSLLNRTWGGSASAAVCDRELFSGFEAIPMAIFLGAMFWLVYRYAEAREKLGLGG